MVQSTRPFPPPPTIREYRDGDFICITKVEKEACRNCGRMKPVNDWCGSCGPAYRIVDFSQLELENREVYAVLIRDDRWSAAYFWMVMYVVALLCLPLYVQLKEWLGG